MQVEGWDAVAGDGMRRGVRRGAGRAGGRCRSGPRAARPSRKGGSAGGGRCRSGPARRAPSAAASALPRERHGAQRRVWFPPAREAGCSPPWDPGFVPLLGPQEKGGPGGEKPAGGRADKTSPAGPGLRARACPSDWASSRDARPQSRPGGRLLEAGARCVGDWRERANRGVRTIPPEDSLTGGGAAIRPPPLQEEFLFPPPRLRYRISRRGGGQFKGGGLAGSEPPVGRPSPGMDRDGDNGTDRGSVVSWKWPRVRERNGSWECRLVEGSPRWRTERISGVWVASFP